MPTPDPGASLLLTDLYELNMVQAYLDAGMTQVRFGSKADIQRRPQLSPLTKGKRAFGGMGPDLRS